MKYAASVLAVAILASVAGCKKQDNSSAPASNEQKSAASTPPRVIPDQEISQTSPSVPANEPAPARPAPAVGRTWTSVDGRTMDAELIARTEDSIRIRRNADGREFTLSLSAVSQADRDYVKTSAIPLTVVKRFDAAKLAEMKKKLPRISPDAPLDANYAGIVDVFGRYERDVLAITEVGFERHLRMLRDRMEADIKRYRPVSVTAVRNPPVLTQAGWTSGGGSWKEVWAARAIVGWLEGSLRNYLDELEKLK